LESLFDLGLEGEMGLSFAAFEKLLIRFVQVPISAIHEYFDSL